VEESSPPHAAAVNATSVIVDTTARRLKTELRTMLASSGSVRDGGDGRRDEVVV
jgi:hypothetical protein